jgi:putative transcriptional regulator
MIRLLALLALIPALAWGGVEDSDQAVLLVAHPRMDDPNFSETVVLVTFPQDSGPMGVVLNRPIGATLGELFDQDPAVRDRQDMVHAGGPVRPDGMLFIFRSAEHPVKALPVVDDIYLSADGRLFDLLVKKTDEAASQRYYAGYAGWAEGQLDAEVERGDWYVLPMDVNVLYGMPEESMWETLLVRATSKFAAAARSGSAR